MDSRVKTAYSPGVKFLHWLIALLVIVMLCVGFLLDSLPDGYQSTAYMLHKSTGITILFLMIIRFIWVHISGRPPLPETMKSWEKLLSRFVQYSFYALLILMPLSGWILSVAADRIPVFFNLFKAPLPWITPDKSLADFMGETHEVIAWIIIVFLTLHILGALKHHFIDKDRVLKTMLPGDKD
jgi:cytochrome b561